MIMPKGLQGFQKGHKAWNKGLKGCIHSGSFKKGHKVPIEWRKKWSKTKKGKFTIKKATNWKGGKAKHKNRWLIFQPNHPLANKQGYIYRARLVMEKKIGRYLKPKEVIHHINGIENDDRPENLWLFRNSSAHANYELNLRWTYKKFYEAESDEEIL